MGARAAVDACGNLALCESRKRACVLEAAAPFAEAASGIGIRMTD